MTGMDGTTASTPERQLLNLPQQVDELDGTRGALIALVAHLRAGAVNGLLEVLGGNDAEHHRHAGLE